MMLLAKDKRTIPVLVAIALGAFAVVLTRAGPQDVGRAQAALSTPNIVVILTDDQRVSDLKFMNKTQRKLARRGTSFKNYLSTFPLCCPARATLLSGQYAHNHGVFSNQPPNGGYPGFDDEGSLPQALQVAGYRTAWIGKYLADYGLDDDTEIPAGWSEWAAPVLGEHKMFEFVLNQNGNVKIYKIRPANYQTDIYAQLATRAIGNLANRSRPFFRVLSVLAPHGEPRSVGRINPRPAPRHSGRFKKRPLPKPPSFNERYTADKPDFLVRPPVEGKRLAQLRNNNRSRLASLLAVDDAVARVMRELRRRRELRNTYVVFTSDNGFMLGEHTQRGKVKLYEESVRVPLIIRGPGVPKNAARTAPVGNVDFVPTILDIADAAPQRTPDGESLLPYLRSRNHGKNRAILLQNRDSVGVRTRRYIYMEHHRGGDEILHYELYDLRHDPYQLQNLIGPDDTETRGNLPDGVQPGEVHRVRQEMNGLLNQLRGCAGSSCLVP